MRTFKKPNRDQLLMLTEVNLETVAPVGSALRSIDELVDQLNTLEIEKTYDLESPRGGKPIHPKTMIKVALYALHNCRFSLRKIEEDTKNHLGYRWLTGDEKIDHSTIGKFLTRYKKCLPELLSQVALIGIEHELIDFEVLNIDIVKIRANASYKQFRTSEGIKKEQKKLRKRLKGLIEDSCREDHIEKQRVLETRMSKLEAAKEELQKRIDRKSETGTEKERDRIEKKERINITDHDCGLMQQANGETNSAYAVTMAIDSGNDFIVNLDVQENPGDSEALIPAVNGSSSITGKSHKVVNADSGFSSIANLEKLEADEQFALIPDRRYEAEIKGSLSKKDYDRSNFIYNNERDCYRCPAGQELLRIASVTVNGRIQYRYANKTACTTCLNRSQCTWSKYRIVSRDKNESVKERMRERFSSKENQQIYKIRSHCAESPFGQIKHNLKYRIFMRRGREKVHMEMSLLCMLHNILKISNILYLTV